MKRNLDALDALKGVAAMAVALYSWSVFTAWADGKVVAEFYLAIDFFFVFTGFLLAEVYRDQMKRGADLTKFVILRFARLYPIHLFFLLPLAGIEAMKMFYGAMGAPATGPGAFMAEHLSLSGLFANLTLTQIFGFVSTPGWNEPSWYVAAEFWVSLAFAGICLVGVMRNTIGRACFFAVVAGAGIWLAVAGMHIEGAGALARGIYAIGLGVAAQSLLRIPAIDAWLADKRARAGLALEVGALVLLVAYFAVAGEGAGFIAPLIFVVVLLAFVDGGAIISRVLKTAPFQVLGRFSYSIYMSHFLFILPMRGVVEQNGMEAVQTVATYGVGVYLGLTLVVGVITEKLVEAPTRDFVRDWLNGQAWAQRKPDADQAKPATA